MSIANRKLNNDFVAACDAGNLEQAKILYNQGARNVEDGMFAAANKNHTNCVYFCVEHGAKHWGRLLEGACRSGSLELFRYAIAKATEPLRSGAPGLGAGYTYQQNLPLACASGNLQLLQELYPLTTSELYGYTSLMTGLERASQLGFLEIVKYCFSVVKVNKLEVGKALSIAHQYHQQAVVDYLNQQLASGNF